MNEHDDDIARLFARLEPPAISEAFTAQVKQRVARERLRANLLTAGGIALALIVILATFRAPFDVLYPISRLQGLLTSFTGMIVCAVGALAITAWQRSADS
jgi:hypothetical protein